MLFNVRDKFSRIIICVAGGIENMTDMYSKRCTIKLKTGRSSEKKRRTTVPLAVRLGTRTIILTVHYDNNPMPIRLGTRKQVY